MRQTIKRCLALFGVLFTVLLISSQVQAKTQRTIKVGYMGYDGFFEKSSSGEMTGYGAEYLNKVAEYTGDKYVYIKCSGGEITKMLRKKEIDLAFTVRLPKEQSSGLEYSNQSLGRSRGVIYTRKDNDNLYYEDFKALHGKKVGVIRGSANESEFSKFARKKNISYQSIAYTNNDVMEQALLQEKVDAIVTDSLDLHYDLKMIGGFCNNPFYLVSYKENSFLSDMDYALSMIMTNDTQYQEKLFQQYYKSQADENSLNLTREESEYIKKIGVIRVGQLPIRYPLSWLNTKTGKLEGVNEDLFDLISKISGLQFEYVALGTKEKTMDALKNNKCDIVAGVLQNEQFLQNPSIILSDPFIESTIAVVTKKGSGFDTSKPYVVAMTKSFQGIQNYISSHYP